MSGSGRRNGELVRLRPSLTSRHIAGQGRFVFILSFLDVFDKTVVGQYRGPVCEGKMWFRPTPGAREPRIEPKGKWSRAGHSNR